MLLPKHDIFTALNLQIITQRQSFRGYYDVLSLLHSCLCSQPAKCETILEVLCIFFTFRVKLLIAQEAKPTLPYMEHGINATSVTNARGYRIWQNAQWKRKKTTVFSLKLIHFLHQKNCCIKKIFVFKKG